MDIGRDEMCYKRRRGKVLDFTSVLSGAGFKFNFDIPEWLLVEVLIRLPVKVVFRFKIVCKKWLSVISDPSFTRIFVSQALTSSPHWAFMCYIMKGNAYRHPQILGHELLPDIHSEDLKCPGLYVLPCPSIDKRIYFLVGVSNGLVLYLSLDCNKKRCINYIISNPITGQCIGLPPHALRLKTIGFVTHVENEILTSYRIVHLRASSHGNIIRIGIFFSETGEWQHFTVSTDNKVDILSGLMPAELNGILHWMTREDGIIAYDSYGKLDCVRFMALPGDRNLTNDVNFLRLIDVHEGRLRYFETSGVHMPSHGLSGLAVWILNDYSRGDWSPIYKIISNNAPYDDVPSSQNLSLEIISFHPFDSDILYLVDKNILYSYNIKSRKLEGHGCPLDLSFIPYHVEQLCQQRTFLLVIPPWPIYIPPPDF